MNIDVLIIQLFPSGATFFKDLTHMTTTIGMFSFYQLCFKKKTFPSEPPGKPHLSYSITYFIHLNVYITVQVYQYILQVYTVYTIIYIGTSIPIYTNISCIVTFYVILWGLHE